MELSEVKVLATRLRRGARQAEVLELCDAVLVLGTVVGNLGGSAVVEVLAAAPRPKHGCPVCEARRATHRALMKRRRAEKRSAK